MWLWLVAMIRPGAAMLAAPLFGARSTPVQIRLILSLAIGMAALNRVTITLPEDGVGSVAGLALVAGEIVAGLAIGFAVQIGYAAAFVAGEIIGNVMGLGFAGMVDPASGSSSSIVGSWLSTLATFLFFAGNGHLLLISHVVESFAAWPPGGDMLGADMMLALVEFGRHLFAAGLLIALPVGFALLLVQVAMAVLARAAPQLNLFAVGFPATLLAGLVLLAMALPVMGASIGASLESGLDMAARIAGGG